MYVDHDLIKVDCGVGRILYEIEVPMCEDSIIGSMEETLEGKVVVD